MEKHKQLLDKEYEQLLTQFSKVTIFTLLKSMSFITNLDLNPKFDLVDDIGL